MLTEGVLSPWKVAVCLFGLVYGILLGMKLPGAGLLVTVCIVILSAALWYSTNQGYSLWMLVPVIVGAIMLITCVTALFTGFPPTSFVPITRSPIELWIMLIVACVYIAWGVRETRSARYI